MVRRRLVTSAIRQLVESTSPPEQSESKTFEDVDLEQTGTRTESANTRALLSWSAVSIAIDELLARTQREFVCLDENLTLQGWESKARFDQLHDAIVVRGAHVRIAVHDTKSIAGRAPRILSLLRTHGHKLSILKSRVRPFPEAAMAVADRQHALFRPVLVQSRGFLYLENPVISKTYVDRFEVIWQHGGTRMFPEAFGL